MDLLAATDVETDASAQRGTPLRVDKTLVLVPAGADPAMDLGRGATALLAASTSGHWLAVGLFEAMARRGATAPIGEGRGGTWPMR